MENAVQMAVVVSLQWEGVHQWAECPFEDVAFLRFPHRHVFHIRAEKLVTHSDRDVEIIKLKREILASLADDFGNGFIGRKSCEDLCKHLMARHGLHAVEVLEDGENGAKIWR